MAAEEVDYLMSVDMFNEPATIEGDRAKAMKIVRLILMNPGSDPLHPEMGVGLKSYRYALNGGGTTINEGLNALKEKTEEQLRVYLPHIAPITDIDFTITVDHKLSIEISINDTMYIYNPDDTIFPYDIATT